MAFRDISSRQAILAAVAEYDTLGQHAFLEKYGFHPARSYFLVVDGREYDSKAIVGAAHGYQFPQMGPLAAPEFSGGKGTVQRVLEGLGFEVRVVAGARDGTAAAHVRPRPSRLGTRTRIEARELPTRKRSSEGISLACFGPAHDSLNEECIAMVTFRGSQSRGSSVRFYARMEPVIDKVVHRSDEVLSWKFAAKSLLLLDDCTVNPEGCTVLVSGVDELESAILERCWSRSIDLDTVTGALACDDEQIHDLWTWASQQIDQDVPNSDCEDSPGRSASNLEVELEQCAEPDADESDDDDRHGLITETCLGVLKEIGRLVASAALDDMSLASIAKALGAPTEECAPWANLIERIREWARSNGLPSYINQHAGSGPLPAVVMSDLLRFPSPGDPDLAARILYSWTILQDKPLAPELSTGSDFPGSPWPFLLWLLDGEMARSLLAFQSLHPNESAAFRRWVERAREHESRNAEINGPRGFGDRYWSGVSGTARRHIQLCDAVLAILM